MFKEYYYQITKETTKQASKQTKTNNLKKKKWH
jgi:hypothetical protein